MNGYWNYTEPVTYRAVIVQILPVAQPVLHWQNAFAGMERQAIEITQPAADAGAMAYTFLIDNEDGMGWDKLQHNGGPDSPSRHIKDHHLVRECNDHEIIRHRDRVISSLIDTEVEGWQKKNHPNEYAELMQLRSSYELSNALKEVASTPQMSRAKRRAASRKKKRR